MFRVSRWSVVLSRVIGHVPRNQAQFEKEARNVLRILFWIAVLAPIVIVPLYYLLVALGV